MNSSSTLSTLLQEPMDAYRVTLQNCLGRN